RIFKTCSPCFRAVASRCVLCVFSLRVSLPILHQLAWGRDLRDLISLYPPGALDAPSLAALLSPLAPRLYSIASSQRREQGGQGRDRKSTRLNSSHVKISYAVFCL